MMALVIVNKTSLRVGQVTILLISHTGILIENEFSSFGTSHTKIQLKNGFIFWTSLALRLANIVEMILFATLTA